jgi:hypothetical protein
MSSQPSRRDRFRKGLSGLYLSVYDGLCNELGEHWQPYDGLRTVERQDQLFAKGRDANGKVIPKNLRVVGGVRIHQDVVTWARGGESSHNYGCASDWTVWRDGEPDWPPLTDKIWREYERACEKVGADWGGWFPKPDFPHNELNTSVSWREVAAVLKARGMDAAMEFIANNRK